MNININDIVQLNDNNKYMVVSKVLYEGENYYFFVNVDDNKIQKILRLNNNKLVEFEDSNLYKNILPLLYNQAVNNIKNLENNE